MADVAVSVYVRPDVLMKRFENTATPADAAMVSVPKSVPIGGVTGFVEFVLGGLGWPS